MNVSADAGKNIETLESTFENCGDFVSRRFSTGGLNFCIAYIDNLVNRQVVEMHVIGRILAAYASNAVNTADNDPYGSVKAVISSAEISDETDFDNICAGIMSGDAALFVDSAEKAMMLSVRGFPSRGVPTAETEATVTGSRESFSEVLRTNTVLVRRRLRDTRLKVKQMRVGRRSKTDVALIYLEDVVRPEILKEAENRIDNIDIDAVLDSGMLEQLIEENWYSPFPQIESTERPDKAAAAILEGRIAIIVDNSPFALIIPTTLNSFYQSSEDYYQRFGIMSFTRIIRYAAGFFAMALPGFYLAVAVYHPSMIPMQLILKMAAARQNVPFPAVVEILIMEFAFELLREAGTRLPKAVGSTLGIVGGLIVGQAAVEAGIVSPIVVIIVALTAISSFAIPHHTLMTGYRLAKYLVIIFAAALGLFGFWAALLAILIHLSALKSFGVPFMFPFEAGGMNGYGDLKDSLVRFPTFLMKKRPFFARPGSRTRMKGNRTGSKRTKE